MKISTDSSRHIYLPSIGLEWDRTYAFPYLGQVPLPRWASPRWAQGFRNHRNMVRRAIRSPVRGVTLKLFQAGSSFVLEAPLSLEHHRAEAGCSLFFYPVLFWHWPHSWRCSPYWTWLLFWSGCSVIQRGSNTSHCTLFKILWLCQLFPMQYSLAGYMSFNHLGKFLTFLSSVWFSRKLRASFVSNSVWLYVVGLFIGLHNFFLQFFKCILKLSVYSYFISNNEIIISS